MARKVNDSVMWNAAEMWDQVKRQMKCKRGGADVQAVRAHDSVRGNPASGNGSDGLELQRGASPVAVKGPAPSGGWVSINHGLTKHRMVPKFFLVA